MLIENGADIDAADYEQWTVLHYAAYYDRTDIVQVSLCPLYAFMAPHAPTLRTFSQLLIDLGADVTAVTDEDWTALHVAARYGHKEIAKVTLAAFWCLDCGSCPTDSARRRYRRRPFDRLRLDTLASRLVRRAL